MTREQKELLERFWNSRMGDTDSIHGTMQVVGRLFETILYNMPDNVPAETITQKSSSVRQLQSDYQLELEKNKELADTCARLAAENHDLRTKVKMVSDVLARKAIDLSEMKESAKEGTREKGWR